MDGQKVSIEMLQVQRWTSCKWELINFYHSPGDILPCLAYPGLCPAKDSKIFILGGSPYGSGDNYSDAVYIYDAKANKFEKHTQKLPYAIMCDTQQIAVTREHGSYLQATTNVWKSFEESILHFEPSDGTVIAICSK